MSVTLQQSVYLCTHGHQAYSFRSARKVAGSDRERRRVRCGAADVTTRSLETQLQVGSGVP